LFASLLVQATHAMTGASSRTRSFRQSFLAAYATRIGQRLAEVTEQAERERATLVPLLARREAEVTDVLDHHFPPAKRVDRRVSVGDRAGWASGTAAADRADLRPPAGRLTPR
jgi:hypothetical protein